MTGPVRTALAGIRRRGRALLPGSTAPAGPQPGLLSVVLLSAGRPNDAAATLAALLAQTYRPMEVVAVAAEGELGEVLQSAAEKDSRLRIVVPGSEGHVQACLRAASGDYVVLVEPGARPAEGLYSGMVAALAASEAGFVSAAPRSTSGPGRPAALMQAQGRMGLDLSEVPSAVADTALWNKAYRRTCLEQMTADLPADAAARDIVLRGYLRAASFDYLGISGGTGPKAPAATAEQLSEDLAGCRRLASLLAAEATAECRGYWYAGGLGSRWRSYLLQVPRSGTDYWQLVQQTAALIRETSGALEQFRLHDRVLTVLAATGDRPGVDTVLAELQDHGEGYRARVQDDGAYDAVPTYWALLGPRADEGVLRLLPADLRMRSRLRGFHWDGDVLVLTGSAYVEGLDSRVHPAVVAVDLVNRLTGRRYPVPVRQLVDPALDEKSGDRFNTYAASGFSARLDTGDLIRSMEHGSTGGQEWYLKISLDFGGMKVEDQLQGRDEDLVPRRLPLGPVVGEHRVVGLMDAVHGLRLAAVFYRFLIDEVHLNGSVPSVAFTGTVPEQAVLRLPDGREMEGTRSRDHPGWFSFGLTEADPGTPAGRDAVALIQARTGTGQLQYAGWAGNDEDPEARPSTDGILLRATGFGFLSVVRHAASAAVTGWALSDDGERLSITGRWFGSHGEETEELVLAGQHEEIVAEPAEHGLEGNFQTDFKLQRDPWGRGKAWPESGTYRLVSRPRGGGAQRPVPVTAGLAARLPQDALRKPVRVAVPATGAGEPFRLQILPPFAPEDRGLYNRQRLVDTYAATTTPLVNAVFFESFAGRAATDSVRAVYDDIAARHPDLRRYWSVADSSVTVPAGSTPLIRFSSDWFQALATARYLINNNTFPVFFRKRPGQIYAQTWHGTPLKRIGFDTPATRVTPSYRRTLEREPQSWDVLLAQSPYAAQTLAAAFRYRGPVAAVGYPRNDPLSGEDAAERRTRIRSRLGIPASHRVLLYAPTWRDTARTRGDKFAAVNHLNFADLQDVLGPGYTLLFRGHHNVASQRGRGPAGALDVTAYPEVADLYLAADLLVTDYSSAMFDFAVTGKPIYLLVPDLDEYRDHTRGFYFDVTAQAPGPLCRSSSELAAHIAASNSTGPTYGDFARRYAPLDDGEATRRFVDSIFCGQPQ